MDLLDEWYLQYICTFISLRLRSFLQIFYSFFNVFLYRTDAVFPYSMFLINSTYLGPYSFESPNTPSCTSSRVLRNNIIQINAGIKLDAFFNLSVKLLELTWNTNYGSNCLLKEMFFFSWRIVMKWEW